MSVEEAKAAAAAHKDVVARVTADNVMFLVKIKSLEEELQRAETDRRKSHNQVGFVP